MNVFKQFEDISPEISDVLFELSREDIEKNDKTDFLNFWNIHRIVKSGQLPRMFDSTMFCVGGYDEDPRPLFLIPEVRTYLKELAKEWPYFFYAAKVENEFLIRTLQCIAPCQSSIQSPSLKQDYNAKFKPDDLNTAYSSLFKEFQVLASYDTTMTQERFDARIEAIQKALQKEFIR